jgi:hypothetical protein
VVERRVAEPRRAPQEVRPREALPRAVDQVDQVDRLVPQLAVRAEAPRPAPTRAVDQGDRVDQAERLLQPEDRASVVVVASMPMARR